MLIATFERVASSAKDASLRSRFNLGTRERSSPSLYVLVSFLQPMEKLCFLVHNTFVSDGYYNL